TPCEMVASTPARRAYLCRKVSVRWSLRAAWSAACCACGLMTSVRRGYLLVDWTQLERRGHTRQSVVENWILIKSGWLFRLSQLQLVIFFPCGQVACRFSQSRTN